MLRIYNNRFRARNRFTLRFSFFFSYSFFPFFFPLPQPTDCTQLHTIYSRTSYYYNTRTNRDARAQTRNPVSVESLCSATKMTVSAAVVQVTRAFGETVRETWRTRERDGKTHFIHFVHVASTRCELSTYTHVHIIFSPRRIHAQNYYNVCTYIYFFSFSEEVFSVRAS